MDLDYEELEELALPTCVIDIVESEADCYIFVPGFFPIECFKEGMVFDTDEDVDEPPLFSEDE